METERYGVTLPFSVFRSFFTDTVSFCHSSPDVSPAAISVLCEASLLRIGAVNASLNRSSAFLRSTFSACTGRNISSSISMSSSANSYGVFPVFFMLAATFSSASGCFNAACTTSPSTEIRILFNATSSLAGQSFFNLKIPLIFSFFSDLTYCSFISSQSASFPFVCDGLSSVIISLPLCLL